MKFSIKRTSAILWKGGVTLEKLQERFNDPAEMKDWEVCPLGEAEKAVPLQNLHRDPSLFEKASKQKL